MSTYRRLRGVARHTNWDSGCTQTPRTRSLCPCTAGSRARTAASCAIRPGTAIALYQHRMRMRSGKGRTHLELPRPQPARRVLHEPPDEVAARAADEVVAVRPRALRDRAEGVVLEHGAAGDARDEALLHAPGEADDDHLRRGLGSGQGVNRVDGKVAEGTYDLDVDFDVADEAPRERDSDVLSGLEVEAGRWTHNIVMKMT